MPRRVPSSQRRVHSAVDNNPYHSATLSTTSYARQNGPSGSRYGRDSSRKYRSSYRKGGYHNSATVDTGLSDPTFTENESYYDYYQDHGYSNHHHRNNRDSRSTQYSLSDESGSVRLPLYDTDDLSARRFSRNAPSDRSFVRPHQYLDNNVNTHSVHKDLRKIYPNHTDFGWDRLYQEIPTPCEDAPASSSSSRRVPPSRSSERPQSSVSSAVTATVVDGCGGRCQTFENICYFFLQLVFTMGILVGLSLCFAAAALRKSAARNLQVLVYIGVLVTMVCSLLLGIQCNARHAAIRRKRALKMAKQRAPIPLEPLNLRNVNQVEQPLVVIQDGSQRIPLPQVHVNRPLPPRPHGSDSPSLIEEPGIPWWRRKDLNHL